VTWKAISVIVAVAVAASSAALYAQRYVTTDDLAPYRAADRALQDQVLRLERDGAATAASIEAIRRASEDTRDDVRSLLRHLLENPPGRKP
jgi:serine protease inhibitor ecotin